MKKKENDNQKNGENLVNASFIGYTSLTPDECLADNATILRGFMDGKIPRVPLATTTVTKKSDAVYAYDEAVLQATLKTVLSPKAKRVYARGTLGVRTEHLDARTALFAINGANTTMFKIALDNAGNDFENKREPRTAKLNLPYLSLKVKENGKDLLKTIKDLRNGGAQADKDMFPKQLFDDLDTLRNVFYYETYREDGTAFSIDYNAKTLSERSFVELLRRVEPHLEIAVDLDQAIDILMNMKRRPNSIETAILEDAIETVEGGYPKIVLSMTNKHDEQNVVKVPFNNFSEGAVRFSGEAAITLLWDLLLKIRQLKKGITVDIHQLSKKLEYVKFLQEQHQTLFSYDGTK